MDHVRLMQVFSDLQVKESFDIADLPLDCPQIEGLYFTADAYMCSNCPRIRGNLASIKEHYFSDHQNFPMPSSWNKVAAQQLHHKHSTPYFQVKPTTIPVDVDAATNFFVSLNNERQKVVAQFDQSKVDPRQVSIWLKATKWHVLVSPYDHTHLISLVAMPIKQEIELEILAKAVDAYTQKADKVMDTLSNLALRVINSPEPP